MELKLKQSNIYTKTDTLDTFTIRAWKYCTLFGDKNNTFLYDNNLIVAKVLVIVIIEIISSLYY